MTRLLAPAARRAFITFFSGLCLCGLACGVALCLYRSASTQGFVISAVGHTYYRQAQQDGVSPESAAYLNALARQTLLQAIALEPQVADHWEVLAAILEQESDYKAAAQARSFAALLNPSRGKTPGKQALSDDAFAAAKKPSLIQATVVERP